MGEWQVLPGPQEVYYFRGLVGMHEAVPIHLAEMFPVCVFCSTANDSDIMIIYTNALTEKRFETVVESSNTIDIGDLTTYSQSKRAILTCKYNII